MGTRRSCLRSTGASMSDRLTSCVSDVLPVDIALGVPLDVPPDVPVTVLAVALLSVVVLLADVGVELP